MSHKWVRHPVLSVVCAGMASGSALAQSREMIATLTGGEEVPTAVNSGAFGSATINVDAGSGDITYTIKVWNLPTGVVGAHFHVGAEKTAGPVIINIQVPTLSSNDFTITGTVNTADFVARPDQGSVRPQTPCRQYSAKTPTSTSTRRPTPAAKFAARSNSTHADAQGRRAG